MITVAREHAVVSIGGAFPDFLKAGAVAVGLGSVLISDEDVVANKFDEVRRTRRRRAPI